MGAEPTLIWRFFMRNVLPTKLIFVLFIAGLLSNSGCAIRYVADYDASIKEEIVQVAKEIDLFWGKLLDMNASERTYSKFKDQYVQVETDIRALVMKNEIRTFNKESTKQANIALDLWVEDREIHKKNDTFSDFEAKRHRKQYIRVFTALAKGEDLKGM
jgi:uncharacterized protein related to proFAR isomerase